MKSLVELQSEIHTLQQQAAELRTREFDGALANIVAQMAAFGITLATLRGALKAAATKAPRKGRGKGRKPARAGKPGKPGKAGKAVKGARGPGRPRKAGATKPAKAAGTSGTRKSAPIKFRGPQGEAWSGRGKTPTWLKTLRAGGQQVADFRV